MDTLSTVRFSSLTLKGSTSGNTGNSCPHRWNALFGVLETARLFLFMRHRSGRLVQSFAGKIKCHSLGLRCTQKVELNLRSSSSPSFALNSCDNISCRATGIEIYCAPTADTAATWQASVTHIAHEGGCFVLSACQFCRRKDYPPHPEYVLAGKDEDAEPDSVVSAGGSVIISPLGTVLAGPNYEGEGLVTADLGK